MLKITEEVKKKNVEADLGALLENETQKLGPGWFYLKMIIISSLPVDLHVKTFHSPSWLREGGSDAPVRTHSSHDPLQSSSCPERKEPVRSDRQLSSSVP